MQSLFSKWMVCLSVLILIVAFTIMFVTKPEKYEITSDLTGTGGRNARSTPPNSILPSNVSGINKSHELTYSSAKQTQYAQLILRATDLYSGAVSGRLDFETRISIINFQRVYDVPISGYLDNGTMEKMKDLE